METIARPKPGDYPAYYGAYLLATSGDDLADALHHADQEALRTRDLVPDDR